MDDSKIIANLNNTKPEEVKRIFIDFIKSYLNPAFGAVQKRDIDILLFMKLQELHIISDNPEIYELVTQLRVTRAKARNLLYEAKLRKATAKDLDEELKSIIQNPIFFKDGEKNIGIEIYNPFVIDHLKYKLKTLKHLTDGSFNPELVKMTADAFAALYDALITDEKIKQNVEKALIECGAKKESGFKGVIKQVVVALGSKIANEAGEELASSAIEYFGPIVAGSINDIRKNFKNIFNK
jgi:hemoglobin-like flavoprotein